MMNPEITSFSPDLFETGTLAAFSADLVEAPPEDDFNFAIPQNEIQITEIKSFYEQLLKSLETVYLSLVIPNVVSPLTVSKTLYIFRTVVTLLKLVYQFLKIGYVTFAEVNRIMNNIHLYVDFIYNKVIIHLKTSDEEKKSESVSVAIFLKYSIIHNFLIETGVVLDRINMYRTNLVVSVVMKFFHTLSLRHNFSVLSTNNLIDHFQRLLSIFNFENRQIETEELTLHKVEDFEKILKFFKKKNDTGEVEDTAAIESLLAKIQEHTASLSSSSSTLICSNLNNIMLILINKGDLLYKNMKKVIDKSLLQFDELYFMKILRTELLKVSEDYYLRPVKVVSKLRSIQFIFDDAKLNEVMQLVEYDPEKIKIFLDFMQKKENDIFMVMAEGKNFIHKIEKINSEMTKHYLNKIYFKKMQKMVQISRLPQVCLAMLDKIYEHVTIDRPDDAQRQASDLKRHFRKFPDELSLLFFTLKRFFVLQMIKSKYNVVGDCDALKDKCIDVFIESGFQCDDLIIELNQYLEESIVQEELENFFRYMEIDELLKYFDNIDEQNLDDIVDAAELLKFLCQRVEQYFNVLRHLTFYPDQEVKASFQSQIINNILQTLLMKKVSDKDFINNFCIEVKKNIPALKSFQFSYQRNMRSKSDQGASTRRSRRSTRR